MGILDQYIQAQTAGLDLPGLMQTPQAPLPQQAAPQAQAPSGFDLGQVEGYAPPPVSPAQVEGYTSANPPPQTGLAGLLSHIGKAFSDPESAVLLSMGSALLADTGYSTKPVTFAESLGKAGLTGLDTAANLRKEGIAQGQLDVNRQEAATKQAQLDYAMGKKDTTLPASALNAIYKQLGRPELPGLAPNDTVVVDQNLNIKQRIPAPTPNIRSVLEHSIAPEYGVTKPGGLQADDYGVFAMVPDPTAAVPVGSPPGTTPPLRKVYIPSNKIQTLPTQTQELGNLTPAAKTELDKGIIDMTNQLDQTNALVNMFDPAYFNVWGKTKASVSALAKRTGLNLTPDAADFLSGFTENLAEGADQQNRYIKAITGAQMSFAEADRILRGIPDPQNDDAITYLTKLATTQERLKRVRDRDATFLRDGIVVPEDHSQGGPADKLFDSRPINLTDAAVGTAIRTRGPNGELLIKFGPNLAIDPQTGQRYMNNAQPTAGQ